ncbi:MAG: helix-turn-helix domain-containing protein [Micromonosporaceae bacterium]
MTKKVGYRWQLRARMAERGMFATTDLLDPLTQRGITLSREQVYRLVAQVPQRLSLTTLAALCDILDCQPGDLIELHTPAVAKRAATTTPVQRPRPRRARVSPGAGP